MKDSKKKIIEAINNYIEKSSKFASDEKKSYFILLDIYYRLNKISEIDCSCKDLMNKYTNNFLGKIDKQTIDKIAKSEYIGDRVALLNLPDNVLGNDISYIKVIKEDIVEKIWNTLNNEDENAIDNIWIAILLKYFMENEISTSYISEKIQDLIMDLGNVEQWKYNVVNNHFYKRKIHNSCHFSSPYMLLYWILLWSKKKEYCDEKNWIIIDKVIKDAYFNIDRLDSLSLALLVSITPNEYTELRRMGIKNIITNFNMANEWMHTPLYYNFNQFDGEFLISKIYVAVVCLEAILSTNKDRIEEVQVINQSKVEAIIIKNNTDFLKTNNKLLESSTLKLGPRNIIMTMKKNCMAPQLEEGDEIEVLCDLNININDILVFKYYKEVNMAHKVIDIIRHEGRVAFITGANNGGLWGYPVFKKDVIGKVISIRKRIN